MGLIDLLASFFIYSMTVGSWAVCVTSFPSIILLLPLIIIQRIFNQITKAIKKQNGICYNCNLKIIDIDRASLEDDNDVYCYTCHQKLFGHLYVNRDGVWYKK